MYHGEDSWRSRLAAAVRSKGGDALNVVAALVLDNEGATGITLHCGTAYYKIKQCQMLRIPQFHDAKNGHLTHLSKLDEIVAMLYELLSRNWKSLLL